MASVLLNMAFLPCKFIMSLYVHIHIRAWNEALLLNTDMQIKGIKIFLLQWKMFQMQQVFYNKYLKTFLNCN